MPRILFVCIGNICRSPLAKAILIEKFRERKINFFVDSAGTESYHVGEPPDKRTIRVAKAHGMDISGYRARKFTENDFENFDLIYVMETDNYRRISALAKNESEIKKVEYLLEVLYPGKHLSVPDPWYGGYDGFEEVYAMLEKACKKIAEKTAING